MSLFTDTSVSSAISICCCTVEGLVGWGVHRVKHPSRLKSAAEREWLTLKLEKHWQRSAAFYTCTTHHHAVYCTAHCFHKLRLWIKFHTGRVKLMGLLEFSISISIKIPIIPWPQLWKMHLNSWKIIFFLAVFEICKLIFYILQRNYHNVNRTDNLIETYKTVGVKLAQLALLACIWSVCAPRISGKLER